MAGFKDLIADGPLQHAENGVRSLAVSCWMCWGARRNGFTIIVSRSTTPTANGRLGAAGAEKLANDPSSTKLLDGA